MSQPLFTIVLPTYNRAALLPRAVRSVLHQTCRNWELHIVNDGSTDETTRVLQTITDSRIHVHAQKENRGVAAARNTGIRLSSGKLVSFLDDDDEYDARFLQTTADTMDRRKLGMTWTGVAFVRAGPSGETVEERVWHEPRDLPEHDPGRFACDLISIGLSYGVTIKRNLFRPLGLLDESLRVAQDTDFFLRYLASGKAFGTIPEVLVRHHIHPGERLTGGTYDRVRLDALRTILNRHRETIQSNPFIRETLNAAERKLASERAQ